MSNDNQNENNISIEIKKDTKFSFLRPSQKPMHSDMSTVEPNKRSKSVVEDTNKKYSNKLISKNKNFENEKSYLDSDISIHYNPKDNYKDNRETHETRKQENQETEVMTMIKTILQ